MNNINRVLSVLPTRVSGRGFYSRMRRWLGGLLMVIVLEGCSGAMMEVQATYQAVQVKATATAYVNYQIQANAHVSSSALATATVVTERINYEQKQAEDQSFVAVFLGWVALIAIVLMATSAVLYRGSYLGKKIELQEKINNDLRHPFRPGH